MAQAAAMGTADSRVTEYRADIDGLRAIAVLAVIAYHLFESALPGGYLGVDIFFVISGYLITQIIWREIQLGRHSIGQFYSRRVRRILPALLVQLVFSTFVASIFLLPATLVSYAKSLVATLGFVGNVYFWQDARNYFSQAAESKPLLHMWSLGVEEQFYIVFPLLLSLLARWGPRAVLATLAVLTVGSLALNVLLISGGLATTAFYMLPARAWELGVGAVIAMLRPKAVIPAKLAGPANLIGVLLLFGSIAFPAEIFSDGASTIPSGLPAVVGVGLLILVGQGRDGAVQRLLQLRPLVFIGLISYSLYLWHWPIIVFAENYLVRELTSIEVLASLGLMLGCATLSWRYVERPFRRRDLPIRTVLGRTGLVTAVLGAFSVALIRADGLSGRLNPQAETIAEAVDKNYRCPVRDTLVVGKSAACAVNLPSRDPADADVLFIGDSFVKMFAPVWKEILADRGLTGLTIWTAGCLPTVTANLSQKCLDSARSNLEEAKRVARAQTVIVGLRWNSSEQGLVKSNGRPIDNFQDRAMLEAVDDLIDRLQQAGKRVVLVGPIASPGFEFASVVSRELAFHGSINSQTYLPAGSFTTSSARIIEHFDSRGDIGFARPDRVQCVAGRCNYLAEGRSLFADDEHIAVAATYRFRGELESALVDAQGSMKTG